KPDLRYDVVDLPELGTVDVDGVEKPVQMVLQELTAEEAQKIGSEVTKSAKEGDHDAMVRWIIASASEAEVVNGKLVPTGKKLFSTGDMEMLNTMGSSIVFKLGTRSVKLSGFDNETDKETLKN